jgi:hypothetical protein
LSTKDTEVSVLREAAPATSTLDPDTVKSFGGMRIFVSRGMPVAVAMSERQMGVFGARSTGSQMVPG